MNEVEQAVTATPIAENAKEGTLERFFGSGSYLLESFVFTLMSKLSSEYKGGMWTFYELSNGGFFMAPNVEEEGLMHVAWADNFSDVHVSKKAAGVIATLMALSLLSFKLRGEIQQMICDRFEQLRDYAYESEEAAKIFAVLD